MILRILHDTDSGITEPVRLAFVEEARAARLIAPEPVCDCCDRTLASHDPIALAWGSAYCWPCAQRFVLKDLEVAR